jgi:hypothetical protein
MLSPKGQDDDVPYICYAFVFLCLFCTLWHDDDRSPCT